MNHSPAKIIRDWLLAQITPAFTSINAKADWPIFVGFMPDGDDVKDNAGCLYDTAGEKVARISAGNNVYKYGVQLRVRAKDYNTGYAKASTVSLALGALHQTTVVISGTSYLIDTVEQPSPVLALGAEPGGKRRELFTLNLLVNVSQL